MCTGAIESISACIETLSTSTSQRKRSISRSAAAAHSRIRSSRPRPLRWHVSATAIAASAVTGSSAWVGRRMNRAMPRPGRLAVTIAGFGDRADREVGLLIEVAQVVELFVGELLLRREEAGVARLGRPALELAAQQRLVLGRDQPQPHRRAVAQHRALDVIGGEEARHASIVAYACVGSVLLAVAMRVLAADDDSGHVARRSRSRRSCRDSRARVGAVDSSSPWANSWNAWAPTERMFQHATIAPPRFRTPRPFRNGDEMDVRNAAGDVRRRVRSARAAHHVAEHRLGDRAVLDRLDEFPAFPSDAIAIKLTWYAIKAHGIDHDADLGRRAEPDADGNRRSHVAAHDRGRSRGRRGRCRSRRSSIATSTDADVASARLATHDPIARAGRSRRAGRRARHDEGDSRLDVADLLVARRSPTPAGSPRIARPSSTAPPRTT